MPSLWRLARGLMLTLSVLTPVLGVQFTNPDYSGIKAGDNFEITWTGDGTVRTPDLLPPIPSPTQMPLTPSPGRTPRARNRRIQQPTSRNDNRLCVPPSLSLSSNLASRD